MTPSLPDWLSQIADAQRLPYPDEAGPPAWDSPSAALSNLLRDGPRRKVVLLFSAAGDHDYDENMTTDVELRLEADALGAYKRALREAVATLGPGRSFSCVPAELLAPQDGSSMQQDTRVLDGIDWTEEYDGGAVSHDSHRLCCWQLGTELLCLQAGKWQGDGNFALFVLATLTPMPPALAAAWHEGAAASAATDLPAPLARLQRRLGLALEAVPEQDEPGPFFPRGVMTVAHSYCVDAQGRVTGLNLARADLVDLGLLHDFVDLERLNLDDNALDDVEALHRLPRLRALSLRANLLASPDRLGGLARLLVHPEAFVVERAVFG